ncbi:amino acid ABC transporter ATP-binding protein [Halopelagius fulvigenes]|uniref:Amino acid ABC transporter ATP-binding protein n=1 Tax=Halopelagius fulvigenes TaxID=1198324 RepID=A0ABD5TYU4_9EURY
MTDAARTARKSDRTRRNGEHAAERGGTRLAAEGVTHGFGEGPVFESVDLTVEPGEVLAVVGPSGTGKTTLLRLLACFHPPDEGVVSADGTDVWSLSEADRLAVRRRVGMVFQVRSLFSTTAAENAAYGLRVRESWTDRLRTAARRALGFETTPTAAREALSTVGMADKAGRRAASLSGGEAQRVAIARALAPDPDVLLLDEPTSNLDPRNTALVEEAVEAARERGIGVAIATHDMQQARRVSDRTAVLLDGSIVECGPTDRVFESPDDERTRKFVAGELVY